MTLWDECERIYIQCGWSVLSGWTSYYVLLLAIWAGWATEDYVYEGNSQAEYSEAKCMFQAITYWLRKGRVHCWPRNQQAIGQLLLTENFIQICHIAQLFMRKSTNQCRIWRLHRHGLNMPWYHVAPPLNLVRGFLQLFSKFCVQVQQCKC